MYRVYIYYNSQLLGPTRLTSEPVGLKIMAQQILSELLTLPGVTGGDIEANIPGIGWVLADEAESILWLHRTSQS